jgi:hypothetical protein
MSKKNTKTSTTKTATPKANTSAKNLKTILKAVERDGGKAQDRLYKVLEAMDILANQAQDGTLSPNVIAGRLRKIIVNTEDVVSDVDDIIYRVQNAEGFDWDMPINGCL